MNSIGKLSWSLMINNDLLALVNLNINLGPKILGRKSLGRKSLGRARLDHKSLGRVFSSSLAKHFLWQNNHCWSKPACTSNGLGFQ